MKSFLQSSRTCIVSFNASAHAEIETSNICTRLKDSPCVGNFLNNRQPIALTYLAFVIKISQPPVPPTYQSTK